MSKRDVPADDFPLEPWHPRDGDQWQPRADLDCDAPFEGQTRHFWLRQVGNAIYFLEKNNEEQNPIFALTHLLAPTHERAQVFRATPELVRHIFRREFALGNWGTYKGDEGGWNMPTMSLNRIVL